MKLTTKLPYYPFLDGLRGLAVLFVIINHWFPHGVLPNYFFTFGKIGVYIFFVLSGYLITSILLLQKNKIEQGSSGFFKEMLIFYLKRFFRIFPLFYLVIALNYFYFSKTVIHNNVQWHVLFLSNFYFVKYKTFISMGVSVFWSLAIEEQFYVFWPFIILKNNIKSVLIIMSVLLLGTLCAKYYLINDFTLGFDFNQFHTLCNLTGLIVGSLLAIAIIKNYNLNLKLIVPMLVFVNLLNWFLPSFMLTEFWLSKSLYFTCELTAVLNTGLFIYLLTKFDNRLDYVKKIFSVKPMVFVGKISFGMYLYHQLVPKITLLNTYYGNSSLRFLILVLVCSVSYYIFERPILNVGHKLINKIN